MMIFSTFPFTVHKAKKQELLTPQAASVESSKIPAFLWNLQNCRSKNANLSISFKIKINEKTHNSLTLYFSCSCTI